MEQQETTKWRKKPQGSESQRKVDKELQRIKSLAVVSVLNKSFQDITPPLPPAMSPSSSLTTMLQKRLAELQTLYDQSHQEADQLREQQKAQCQLLVLQDKLIQEMTDHIEDLNTNSPVLDDRISHSETEKEVMALLPKAQEDLSWLQTELEQLMPLKTKYESFISDMTLQLKAYDQKADELETLAREIQKESRAQTLYIDAKVQALVNKVLERNEVISRLQYQMHTEKQVLPKIDNTSSIRNSTRSSMASTDTAPSKIYTSRWKGSSIPPASPPPSLPLPPIPNSSVISRPKSVVSEVSEYSNTKSNKHVSIDAVAMSVTEATSAAEAAYYKEFTEQLHARLSISKEIDDLRVWQPSDFEEIQKKLQSEYWPEISEKDQHAFWKGMKKKLRV
ncbi:hypothetical protein EDC96DRAFT_484799 [Choanephora cucurbitarum]|nr:hypothetical protein EDC96DRAFT_484799 [Choanephora cucurbitarum]